MIIGCLGDSNTRFGTPPGGFNQPGPGEASCWPEFAPTEVGGSIHTWVNVGLGGGVICAAPPELLLWDALEQLPVAVAAGAQVIVSSFITNDIRVLARTRSQIIDGCCALVKAALAHGLPTLLCTGPACNDAGVQPQLDKVNTRLATLSNRGWKIIDFHTGSVDALEADGVHVTAAAQHLRAQAVIAAIGAL